MEKKKSLFSRTSLKTVQVPSQSFSLLYVVLIICTIIFICIYSLPLTIGNSTLKPFRSKLVTTLERQEALSRSLKSDEKPILVELFGEMSSTASSVLNTDFPSSVHADRKETEVEPGTLSKQKTQDSFRPASKIEPDDDSTADFDTIPSTELRVTHQPKEKDPVRHSSSNDLFSETTKKIPTTHTAKEIRTTHTAKEIRTTHTAKEIRTTHTAKEIRTTHTAKEIRTTHTAKEIRTQYTTGEARTTHPIDGEEKPAESINATKPEKEFLVFSDHCKIPNIDPYHQSILKYVQDSPLLVCKGEEPITKTEGNTLFIDKKAIRRRHLKMSTIKCLYMEIMRPKAVRSDNSVSFGFNHTFTDKVEIKDEFIRVICSFKNGTEFYEGFHSFIHDKPKVEKRCNKNSRPGYSILIVGIDSMSRMNMHRQLKKSARYLLNDMEAVEMYGFNKVGDNTFPNLMALLTGYDERELKDACWKPSKKKPLDKCNFAWKQFVKEGYRSFYAEDAPHMSTFNYLKAGFRDQPTDYYFRHFILVMEQSLGIKKLLNTYVCLGNISETEAVLRWAEKFASHFKNRKYFSFSWINGLTHDFLNKGSAVDHIYERFFRTLHTTGALDKTIVIVMGDHGMRWGSIRKTYIGRLEERLPLLMIALPPEFKREYPTETKALQLNSHRLVTPFDIHATLINILHLDKNFTFSNSDRVDEELAKKYTARAKTLFQPVPEDRSCDDAFIDEHWCTCETSLPVHTDDKVVQNAADFLIDYINSLLKPVRRKCAVLKLKSITEARVWTSLEEHQGHFLNDTILTLIVKVSPSGAIFEGTVRTSEPSMNLELQGTVSRLNLYGDQSACVHDAVLRKYCYCLRQSTATT